MGVASWVGGVRQGLSTLNLLPTPLEWASLLLLLEVSITDLPSHSCLHVQELHNTQTGRQTDAPTHTHYTHIHTQYVYYMNVLIILMCIIYINKKYSKVTME